jgi:3-phytase
MFTQVKRTRRLISRVFFHQSKPTQLGAPRPRLCGVEALESRVMLASTTCQNFPPVDIPAIGDPVSNFSVSAAFSTDDVGSGEADDPAIWRHPTDCSKSLILGTAKDGGIYVYDLSGDEVEHLTSGKMNNIDLRYGFMLGGQVVDLVTASDRSTDSIDAYVIDESGLSYIGTINSGISVYGYAMAHDQQSDTYYGFVSSKSGRVEQWRLNEGNSFSGNLVRSFDVGGDVEGIVSDDQLGFVYIAEEDGGLYKYGLDPSNGSQRTQIDNVSGHLTADTEGLALYYGKNGTGYLIASAQGADEFVVYAREGNNQYLTTFDVGGVSNTDGIDVINVPMGDEFPTGFLIVQNKNQDFRLVPWESIADAGNLAIFTGSALAPPDADLSITNSDGVTTVEASETLGYTIAVTNNGPSSVSNTTVIDNFPAELTGVTWTASGTGGAGGFDTSGNGNINDAGISLASGATITYLVTATVDATVGTTLSNTANVSDATVADPVSSNNSATDTVTVAEPNTAPDLGLIGNKSVNEGATLNFTATATDSDTPANTLSFSLDATSINAGMSINSSTGQFSWTPTETQGPDTFSVTVTVTDNGSPNLSDFETFNITIDEVNTAPNLGLIGNKSVNQGATLNFTATATDSDIPANTLSFSLDATSINAGMSINSSTGQFSWTPTETQGPDTFSVTVTVTDNGSPNLSDFETFNITVNGAFQGDGFEGGLSDWETNGDASTQNAGFGENPSEGSQQAVLTTNDGQAGNVTDTDLESFLGLSASALDGLNTGNATAGSAMKREITVEVGDQLTFQYNFLTNESTPDSTYNDFAFFSVTGGGVNDLLELSDTATGGFGSSSSSYRESTGYQLFTYTFTSSGTYTIGFGVTDMQDTIFDSALLVDDLVIT